MFEKSMERLIKENTIDYVDLRFTDTLGKEHHVSVPASIVNKPFFKEGKMFDGSSITGWKEINDSDMLLMPASDTAFLDPFYPSVLNIRCDVLEPLTLEGYNRCPRSLAKRAEDYLISTGIADVAYFGPEAEFFIFDSVWWENTIQRCFYKVESKEASWNSATEYEDGNKGHRPSIKGGYFPVSPVDSCQDMRMDICNAMSYMGLAIEATHHEVATAGQNEVATVFNSLVKKADETQIYKYAVHNVAARHGKTATFLPKPLVGDNGSGMHCHQSLAKNGQNLFTGNAYAGLSELAIYYIGGILKHAKALNALTNPTTNSYKRLVPGFEAPTFLSYSSRNRSAAIRIPISNPKARRIEVRFPDPTANPYFAFSAMLMAGLDGIQNKIIPSEPIDKNLYHLTEEESKSIPNVCSSLEHALDSLNDDRAFLVKGNVFNDDMLDTYIELKRKEVLRLQAATHPLEFEMYYSL